MGGKKKYIEMFGSFSADVITQQTAALISWVKMFDIIFWYWFIQVVLENGRKPAVVAGQL